MNNAINVIKVDNINNVNKIIKFDMIIILDWIINIFNKQNVHK
jgi:hypothetical protein